MVSSISEMSCGWFADCSCWFFGIVVPSSGSTSCIGVYVCVESSAVCWLISASVNGLWPVIPLWVHSVGLCSVLFRTGMIWGFLQVVVVNTFVVE